MEELDKIREKITDYHSPLSIEEEWDSLVLNQENISLYKKLRRRNLIILFIIILLLCLISTCSYQKYFHQKNDILITPQKEAVAIDNNTKIIENNHQIEPVDLENTTPSKIKETVNDRNTHSSKSDGSLNEPQNNETKIFNTKTKTPNNSRPSDLVHRDKNNHTIDFGKTQSQKNTNSNLDTIALLPEIIKKINKEATTKNISKKAIPELPKLQVELISKDSSEALSLPNLDSLPSEPPLTHRKNYALLEALGQGGFYSLNYGRTIRRQSYGQTDLQIGLSYFPLKIAPAFEGETRSINTFLVPLSINQSFKLPNNHHHLTFGLGVTVLVNAEKENELERFSFIGKYKLGYRYQKKNKRFFYQAEIVSPFYFSDPSFVSSFPCLFCNSNNEFIGNSNFTKPQVWGSVGIGWTF